MKSAISIQFIFLMFLLSFLTAPLGLATENDAQWTWAGFEVMGNTSVSRNQITSLVPLTIGSKYLAEPIKWNQWCETIKSTFNLEYTNCSAVRYPDNKAYLIIDVVEKGQKERLAFRSAPTGDIPLANEEVLKDFKILYDRMFKLFDQGEPPLENAEKGYLDYSDPEMSKLAEKLVKKVPAYRKNLIEVIKFDRSATKRGKAATLLNWALNTEDSIKEVTPYLNDPDSTVRNNISRFMLHFYSGLRNSELRKSIIAKLADQLLWPSHGDRNKAINGLMVIATNHPTDLKVIEAEAKEAIQYLDTASVLDNVQGPAKELLKLFNVQQ